MTLNKVSRRSFIQKKYLEIFFLDFQTLKRVNLTRNITGGLNFLQSGSACDWWRFIARDVCRAPEYRLHRLGQACWNSSSEAAAPH